MVVERLNLEINNEADILVNEHWLRYEAIAPLIKDKIVLDIACGSGYGTNYLAAQGAREIIGADIDEDSIKNNQVKYPERNIKFQVADALNLSFESNKFDVIVSLETIEHFTADQQIKLLQEFRRVLKEDGLLIISTPNTLASRTKNPWHLQELTKEEFRTLLKNNFQASRIYEQGSALTSFIKGGENSQFKITADFQAKYYLALASGRELTEQINSCASLNPLALAVKENHPLMIMLDKIYYQLNKSSLFAKIFKNLSKKARK